MRKKTTLKDIASATGFSVNTVSHALRGKDDVAAATKGIICDAAKNLGYVENAIARSMRLGYTSTIAVILGDVSNPHFGILMKDIEASAAKESYTVFLLNTNEDAAQERFAIETAIRRNVDGIIICPTQKDMGNLSLLKASGVPFVLVGRHFDDEQTSCCVCDDCKGGRQATEYLIRHGHRRILMLNGPSYISSARERLEGYRSALEESGIPYDQNLVKEIPIVTFDRSEMIENSIGGGFSAVFAFSDIVAWRVWNCLKANGLRVPEDVSIIGFDHIQSRLSLPFSLASVSTYKAKMAVGATRILLDMIRGKCLFRKEVIDTNIAEGESVGDFR